MRERVALVLLVAVFVPAGCGKEEAAKAKHRVTSPFHKKFTAAASALNNDDARGLWDLLQGGVDPNIKLLDGTTLLHAAAGMGRVKCVEVLLQNGADANILCPRGTALHFATLCPRQDHPDVVRLLLKVGVDVNAKDSEGNTAFDNAVMHELTESIRLLGRARAKSRYDGVDVSAITKELCAVKGMSIRRALYPSASYHGQSMRDNGAYTGTRVSLMDVLAFLSPERIRIYDYDALPDGVFNVSLQYDLDDPSRSWRTLVDAYERSFKVRIRKVRRALDVKALRRLANTSVNLVTVPADALEGYGTSARGYRFRGYSMALFAEFLEETLGVPVLDETFLNEKYSFELDADHFEPDTVVDGVRKLGLELVDTEKELDLIAIEKRE